MDFFNSSPFKTWASFYAKFTGDFEHFEYFNFLKKIGFRFKEKLVLKLKQFFKIGFRFKEKLVLKLKYSKRSKSPVILT